MTEGPVETGQDHSPDGFEGTERMLEALKGVAVEQSLPDMLRVQQDTPPEAELLPELSEDEGVESLSDPEGTIEVQERRTLAERHPDWPPVKLKFLFGPHG